MSLLAFAFVTYETIVLFGAIFQLWPAYSVLGWIGGVAFGAVKGLVVR